MEKPGRGLQQSCRLAERISCMAKKEVTKFVGLGKVEEEVRISIQGGTRWEWVILCHHLGTHEGTGEEIKIQKRMRMDEVFCAYPGGGRDAKLAYPKKGKGAILKTCLEPNSGQVDLIIGGKIERENR